MSDDQHLEIEEKERDEILEEIDELVATNRLPISEDMETLKPQKSGTAFPLLINIFAIAAVISTFYFSGKLFEQKQEDLSIKNASYLSAEGKLLEELKKESAVQLEQKDQEIGAIQDELAELDRQSRELAESMDQQIADREAELRLALEAELEGERAKLRAQGKSETDIESELNQIEQQRSAEYEAELSAFRASTEEAIADKERELAMAKALNEELLAEVNAEKERIENETRQRETELTAQFEAEKAVLAEEAAAAEAQLEQLNKNRKREELIIDQINGSYESIFSLLESGNSEEALKQVEALKILINEPGLASLEAVNARSGNDRDMIEIITEKIEEQAYKNDVDTTSLTAAADMLLSAQEIAGLGTEAWEAGRTAEAGEYYSRSLEKIPALKQAWQNLDIIQKNIESERMTALLDEGRSLEEQGLQSEAAQQFAQAARSAFTFNPALLNRAVDGILSTMDADKKIQLAAKDAEISGISQLTGARAEEINRLQTELAEVEAGYKQQLAAITTDHEAQLAAARADFEAKLVEAGADLTNIEAEKNTEIEQLRGDKEAAEAALADAEQTIEEGRAYIAELEASTEAEIGRLKAASEAEIEKLKAEITDAAAAAQEAVNMNEAAAEIEELRAETEAAVAETRAAADEEIQQIKNELAEAESKYSALMEEYSLSEENLASRLRASQVTGYNSGLKQGRSTAFEDILSFTAYLDGSAELDDAAENEITEKSKSESLYGEAIQRIQDLAAAGTAETGTEIIAVAQNILIGTVSYASGNSITIEPLTQLEIETGTRITIKRIERGRDEQYVTFGVITSASEGRISARTDPASEASAQSMDLVYIVR
ncbi:MAG: hypothetical protein PQJ61_01290 [Spirochaetales bacterium]|uniref:Uncharacterized protein n=1 Tax=Candidatus Thalassospirochaeta sargassi TaxID=3119039 RepID=A0AAJ1MHL0_9SPIO|nr:hypothetical protein [Spirochaetales bacterium]